jgi:hypothetical protein
LVLRCAPLPCALLDQGDPSLLNKIDSCGWNIAEEFLREKTFSSAEVYRLLRAREVLRNQTNDMSEIIRFRRSTAFNAFSVISSVLLGK